MKFRKRKRRLLSCGPVLDKTLNKAFSRRSRALTAKRCTKKCDACAKSLFCQSKPVAFLPYSFTSASSLVKLLRPHGLMIQRPRGREELLF